MNKREQQDEPAEDQVEFSDLDSSEFPSSPFAQGLARALERGIWSRKTLVLSGAMIVVLALILAAQLPRPASQHPASDHGIVTTANQLPLAFFPAGQMIYIRAPDNTVTAYHSSDGRALWRVKLAGFVNMSATDQALYYVLQMKTGGLLAALDARDGRLLWSQAIPLPGPVPSLLVKDGTIYTSTRDGWLETFRASDGKKLWTYHYAQSTSLPLDQLLAVEQGLAIVESPGGVSHILRASDGTEIIQYVANAGPPLVDAGILYLFLGFGLNAPGDSDGTIQALSTSDGKLLWQYTMRGNENWSPVEIAGTVYAGSSDGALLAFRGTDGRRIWTYRARNPVIGAPTGQNGRVYALLLDGTLVALRATDGALLWKTHIAAFAHSPGYTPILAGHQLFLSNLAAWGNVVYALRSSDGSLLWHHDMGSDNPLHAPTLFNGIFYLSQNDGSLDAWRASDGVHLWHYVPQFPTDWIWPETTGNLLYVKALNGSLTVLQASNGTVLWRYTVQGGP
jgi:outer membrane protein assembly factor BamB